MQPSISVVIPTFNNAQTVVKAIDSVFNQSVANVEILIVDDGSVDSTAKIIHKYLRSRQVFYFQKANQGQGAARNLGVRHAKGEWIAFLDADDVWLPNKIAHQIQLVKNHPGAALVFGNAKIHNDAVDRGLHFQDYCRFPSPSAPYYPQLLTTNFVVNSSVLIHKDVFEVLGGFDEDQDMRRIEDYDLWLRVMARYQAVGSLEPVLTYRMPLSHNRDERAIMPGLKKLYWKQVLRGPWRWKHVAWKQWRRLQ